MTCIVAVEHEGVVYMGSDRAGSNGYTIAPYDAPKTFTNGPALIGFTSSFRMGQILRYGLEVPSHTLSWDVDRWMATDFMLALREAYGRHGWDRTDNGVAKGGNFLIAIHGRCYEVHSNYAFLRSVSGEYATGSGEDHAMGALYATRSWSDPTARVMNALEAAAEHCTTVAGPFDIVTQERP